MDNDFEIRIGQCKIPCKKQYAESISETVSNFLSSNHEAPYMDIKLSYFNEEQDKEFIRSVFDESNEDLTLSPGREIFFRYFCTEMKINQDRKNCVFISSISDPNEKVRILAILEEKLLQLNEENFNSTHRFFTSNPENNYLYIDKYSVAYLILNSCFARPFSIELYLRFLCCLTLFDTEQISEQKQSDNLNNRLNLFENFMKCFSFELNEAFLSTTDYPHLDEISFIVRYLYDNGVQFNKLLYGTESIKENFLDHYYKGKYPLFVFNRLKPIFIDSDIIPITAFDEVTITSKFADDYFHINQDLPFHKRCMSSGLNSDKLARLIHFDDAEKLERTLHKSYKYMMEHQNDTSSKHSGQLSSGSSASGSFIFTKASNNNFGIELKLLPKTFTDDRDFLSFIQGSGTEIIDRDVSIEKDDIKEIASKLAPYYTVRKSIYERCSMLNNKCTLLEYAAFCGSVKCFKVLLKHSLNKDENNDDSFDGFKINLNINDSLAHFAVAGGSLEIIEIIRKQINSSEEESEDNKVRFANTLNDAIRFHQWEIAEWLISDMKNEFKLYQSFLTECIKCSNMRLLLFFLENRIRMDNSFLLSCCRYGNYSLAEWALSFATRDVVNCQDIDSRATILHYACLLNHKPILDLILTHRRENKSIAYNTSGINAKYNRCFDSSYVNSNLDFGVGINTKTDRHFYESTALHLAVEDNNFEFVKMILDEGILPDSLLESERIDEIDDGKNERFNYGSLNIERKNRNSMTPFHLACKNGSLDIVNLFLNHENYRVDINAETAGIFIIRYL